MKHLEHPFAALDHVKQIRAGYNACTGSLYKNVAVGEMQTFLEKCIAKWGERFMECVKREADAEVCGPDWVPSYGDKGKRELVFPEFVKKEDV